MLGNGLLKDAHTPRPRTSHKEYDEREKLLSVTLYSGINNESSQSHTSATDQSNTLLARNSFCTDPETFPLVNNFRFLIWPINCCQQPGKLQQMKRNCFQLYHHRKLAGTGSEVCEDLTKSKDESKPTQSSPTNFSSI